MAAEDWNFLAGHIDGDGYIDIVETELPINISSIDHNLSTPSSMSGSIENAVRRLKVNGKPIFQSWNTVILAEASGQLRGMTVYRQPTFTGANWTLDQIGFPGYAIGMPYKSEQHFTGIDALDIFRHIWSHLQGFPRGNLGITIDPLLSGRSLGTPLIEGDNESGPYTLSWWDSKDCGALIDELASDTPFDWREDISWREDGSPACHLALGAPIIGRRVPDHRSFVLGENLADIPSITEDVYVNEVEVLGAGEGRDRVRGYHGVTDGRLRRTRVVDDKGIQNVSQADSRARDELNATRGELIVDQITVFDHPNAPIEAIQLGDEYPLYAETEHVDFEGYVRVVGKSVAPTKSDEAVLTVVRTSVA